jgi:hypothetical protein
MPRPRRVVHAPPRAEPERLFPRIPRNRSTFAGALVSEASFAAKFTIWLAIIIGCVVALIVVVGLIWAFAQPDSYWEQKRGAGAETQRKRWEAVYRWERSGPNGPQPGDPVPYVSGDEPYISKEEAARRIRVAGEKRIADAKRFLNDYAPGDSMPDMERLRRLEKIEEDRRFDAMREAQKPKPGPAPVSREERQRQMREELEEKRRQERTNDGVPYRLR